MGKASRKKLEALFLRLKTENEGVLKKLCASKLPEDKQLQEDCLQETYVALYEQLEKNGAPYSPKAWLCATLRHKIADVQRDICMQRERHLSPDGASGAFAEPFYTPDFLEDRHSDRLLDSFRTQIMERLSDDERELLRLAYEEELPVREIAKRLGVTPNTVSQRMFRLRSRVTALVHAFMEDK